MINAVRVTATVTSAALGSLLVLGGPVWTHYAVTAWRTVALHLAVLVALVRRRRVERREWEESPLAHPEAGWEDDPDTLRNLPVVRVPEQTAVEVPESTGRHSRGAA